MSVNKVSADQIYLGNETLSTSKIDFEANELITYSGLKINRYDSWSISDKGVISSGDYWFTISSIYDLLILEIGVMCLTGDITADFYYTYDFVSFFKIGGTIICSESNQKRDVSLLVPSLKDGENCAIKVSIDSTAKDLNVYLNYHIEGDGLAEPVFYLKEIFSSPYDSFFFKGSSERFFQHGKNRQMAIRDMQGNSLWLWNTVGNFFYYYFDNLSYTYSFGDHVLTDLELLGSSNFLDFYNIDFSFLLQYVHLNFGHDFNFMNIFDSQKLINGDDPSTFNAGGGYWPFDLYSGHVLYSGATVRDPIQPTMGVDYFIGCFYVIHPNNDGATVRGCRRILSDFSMQFFLLTTNTITSFLNMITMTVRDRSGIYYHGAMTSSSPVRFSFFKDDGSGPELVITLPDNYYINNVPRKTCGVAVDDDNYVVSLVYNPDGEDRAYVFKDGEFVFFSDLPAKFYSCAVSYYNGRFFYCGTDGEFVVSNDHGQNWEIIANSQQNMGNVQVVGGKIYCQSSKVFYEIGGSWIS